MKGIYGAFKTDNSLETAGKWFPFSSRNEDGSIPRFKLRRMAETNPQYLAALERLQKELGRSLELDLLDDKENRAHMVRVFVDTVLVTWENVFDADNKLMEYSKETATALLTELPDLYRVLAEEARKLQNFRTHTVATVSE